MFLLRRFLDFASFIKLKCFAAILYTSIFNKLGFFLQFFLLQFS